MNRSPLFSITWKLFASFVCVILAISPIANLSNVPVARAAGEGSGGISDTPTPIPCGVGIWCTDVRQAQEVEKVKKRLDYQLLFPLYLGVLNATTMMAQQLAYDT